MLLANLRNRAGCINGGIRERERERLWCTSTVSAISPSRYNDHTIKSHACFFSTNINGEQQNVSGGSLVENVLNITVAMPILQAYDVNTEIASQWETV